MKVKKWFIIFISLLYLDLVFNLFAYNSYLRDSIINIIIMDLINSILIFLLTTSFNKKVNKILTYVIYTFLWFWYSLFYIFYKVFISPFSIALFRQTDQTLKFGKNIIFAILENSHIVILFILPVILFIIFRKNSVFNEKIKLKKIFIYFLFLVLSISLYFGNVLLQDKEIGSTYNLVFETNNVSLNIERLGVMGATYLDVYRSIFGFEEKIKLVEEGLDIEEEVFEWDYNIEDIDFKDNNEKYKLINNYMLNESGTKKNKYTGMFKGMNLIYIVAESFSEIAVSEEYTPTLYKLVHDGFYFKNFYTSNNLSTIGGEFQALTGLYADNTVLSSWRGGLAHYPYGLGNVFGNIGYKTYAYHNNSAYYQDRNVYLKTQGFDNYKGCYNGMEKIINCEQWPQSDIEMIEGTVSDYINNDDLFLTYYMTVSGHFYYNKNENSIVNKNYDLVKDLDYSPEVKGYIATQMELDKALEILLDELETAGKLDNTVIVLLADHFPYNLSIDDINSLSSYERDVLIEANSNSLVIYNSKMKSVEVDKVGMSIDVLPTVLNLFDVKYDSRLIMGKDILSSSEGIAIFKDKSWVTNKGTYMASTGKFLANEEVTDDYVEKINNIVNNRVAISRKIVIDDYYKYIMKK